jgi:mannose-6-phosphate isomerase-like protein (cupin superfamily)
VSDARAVIVPAGEARRRSLRAGRGDALQLVDQTIGARLVDLHVNVLRAGSGPGPYHRHSAAENVYFILEGAVRVRVDGSDHVLHPGDAAFIPPGVAHSATNVGNGDARLIEIYAPPEPDFLLVEGDPDSDGGRT